MKEKPGVGGEISISMNNRTKTNNSPLYYVWWFVLCLMLNMIFKSFLWKQSANGTLKYLLNEWMKTP